MKIQQVEEAEVEEMWSVVEKKTPQRWLWHAIDHRTGVGWAYGLGTHEDDVFIQGKALGAPWGIRHFYTDGVDVYDRHLKPEHHPVGKASTQKIERKHLTFRTRLKRLVRKTIGFSKSVLLHDIVMGLIVNRYEFGIVSGIRKQHIGNITELYAERLTKEVVTTTVKRYPGQMHGFMSNAKLLPKAYDAIGDVAAALKANP